MDWKKWLTFALLATAWPAATYVAIFDTWGHPYMAVLLAISGVAAWGVLQVLRGAGEPAPAGVVGQPLLDASGSNLVAAPKRAALVSVQGCK
jgi:hypothetical protein